MVLLVVRGEQNNTKCQVPWPHAAVGALDSPNPPNFNHNTKPKAFAA